MKILLTGKPKAGKSTLFTSVLADVSNTQGFVTQEIREHDERVGFRLISASGNEAVLAHIGLDSPYKVSRYFVDVAGLTQFIQPLFSFTPDQLLYIDEIGQMELFSEEFKTLVRMYLEAKNDFIGTLTAVYSDDFVEKIKSLKSVLLIELNPENRDALSPVVAVLLSALPQIQSLTTLQQQKIQTLAVGYFQATQYIQLLKLFKNAINYLVANKVKQVDSNTYVVMGNTARHRVRRVAGQSECDCDLFRGRGLYAGNSGQCSHIQAVELLVV